VSSWNREGLQRFLDTYGDCRIWERDSIFFAELVFREIRQKAPVIVQMELFLSDTYAQHWLSAFHKFSEVRPFRMPFEHGRLPDYVVERLIEQLSGADILFLGTSVRFDNTLEVLEKIKEIYPALLVCKWYGDAGDPGYAQSVFPISHMTDLMLLASTHFLRRVKAPCLQVHIQGGVPEGLLEWTEWEDKDIDVLIIANAYSKERLQDIKALIPRNPAIKTVWVGDGSPLGRVDRMESFGYFKRAKIVYNIVDRCWGETRFGLSTRAYLAGAFGCLVFTTQGRQINSLFEGGLVELSNDRPCDWNQAAETVLFSPPPDLRQRLRKNFDQVSRFLTSEYKVQTLLALLGYRKFDFEHSSGRQPVTDKDEYIFRKWTLERKLELNNQNSLAAVIAITGDYAAQEADLYALLNVLACFGDRLELIIVSSHEQILLMPLITTLTRKFPLKKLLYVPEAHWNPARLFNQGIRAATAAKVFCLWPGCAASVETMLPMFLSLPAEADAIHFYADERKAAVPYAYPSEPSQAHWVTMHAVYDLDLCCLPAKLFESHVYFDETPFLQGRFFWEFCARIFETVKFKGLGSLAAQRARELESLGDRRETALPEDVIHRYILRPKRFIADGRVEPAVGEMFEADMPEDILHLLRIQSGGAADSVLALRPKGPGLRLTIVGNLFEHHHITLAFYRYIDALAGQGFATYRTVCEEFPDYGEKLLDHSDMVIFCRCRNPRSVKVATEAKRRGIPTVFMLDDNWFCVWKEADIWGEEYARLINPASEFFRNFVAILRECTVAITYNKLLCEDLSGYHPDVRLMPIDHEYAVEAASLPADIRRLKKFLVGFAGSARTTLAAFRALAELARSRADTQVLLFGGLTMEQESVFSKIPVLRLPFMAFKQYKAYMKALKPDVMLAPADGGRTTSSKCPNKYIDITEAGAVGVYSDVYLYNSVIEDERTGLLVGGDKVESWVAAISRLLEDDELRRGILRQASADIARRFNFSKNIAVFQEFITSLAGKGGPDA